MSLQSIDINADLGEQFDLYNIAVGSISLLIVDIPQRFDIRGASDNSLGKQKPGRQIEFVARCAHGDGDALNRWRGIFGVAKANFQWLLHCDSIGFLAEFLLADTPHRNFDAHLGH